MEIAGVIRESVVDGPGIRYVVFAQGCPHNCRGCHNPSTHKVGDGRQVSIDALVDDIKKNPLLSGVTFSGGEPTLQAKDFCELAKKITQLSLDIVMYSGYTFEELIEKANCDIYLHELLFMVDYLIDGPYIESQRDLSLQFRGSKNQNIIDMKQSLLLGEKKCLKSL